MSDGQFALDTSNIDGERRAGARRNERVSAEQKR